MTTNLHAFEAHDLWQVLTLVPGRPLFMTSLYLNYLIGGMNPAYFRWVNAVGLALAGMVLVLLVVAVLERPDSATCFMKLQNRVVAVFLGFLFVTHPLQVHVVLYIWQRQAMMACLFYLSAVATYIIARGGRIRHVSLAYLLTSFLFLGGLTSKENIISLPAVLAAAELTLFRQTYKELARRIAFIALMCFPVLLVYVGINDFLTGPETYKGHRGFVSRLLFFYEISGLSFLEVLLTECRVLFSYLGMIVAPVPDRLPLVYAETISRSLWEPKTTAAACIGVVGLLVAGLGLARKRPVAAFGILFYLLTSLPEAFLIPLFLFFSYRAILPMAGIALILADLFSGLLVWAPNRVVRATIAACLVAPAIYFGFVTTEKAQRWHPLEIWKDDYALLPGPSEYFDKRSYVTILSHYGLAVADTGDIDTPQELFQRAKELAPNYDFAYYGVGYTKFRQGKFDEAAQNFLKVTELKPHMSDPHYWLGLTKARHGKLSEAMEHYRKAIELEAKNARAHFGLAEILAGQGNVSEAVVHYQKAIENKRDFFEAYMGLGSVMLWSGQADKAREFFEKAVALRPDRAEAHAGLGSALLLTVQSHKAVEHLRKALEIRPDLPEAKQDLERALEKLNMPDTAPSRNN
ncbi:MAG: tetratricopeptide repeat protein [Deltaproteobacteria bacterium]|nr:tetratricopeptide repeat protein [Deltaproteobacteria bacterium]